MAAPRASSFAALRNLQRVSTSTSTSAKRGLHMTGMREAAQRIEPAKSIYTTWGFQDLRNECQKRTLTASGNKHELVDRLAAHDSLQHRALHMALRRVAKDQQKKAISGPADSITFRTFKTSRANKAHHAGATLDSVYLPKLFEGIFIAEPAAIRVPILPHIESDAAEAVLEKFPELDAAAGGYQDTNAGDNVMKAEIQPAVGLADVSAMSDVHDGHLPQEMSVEMLTKLTETVNISAKQLAEAVKDEGTIRKIWNGILDDLFGNTKTKA